MIPQEEEKHKQQEKSSIQSIESHQEQPASPPPPVPDCLPASPGDDEDAYNAFLQMVQEASEDVPHYDWRVFNHREVKEAYRLAEVKFAPLVTRGPHTPPYDTPPTQKTKIDTLSFTAEEPYFIMQEILMLSCNHDNLMFLPRKNGINGYSRGFNIVLNGQDLGVLSYGSGFNDAQNSRPQIYIEGSGKTDKFNFAKFYYWAKKLKEGRIKRVDIALDTFKKEFSIESAIEAHLALKFKAPKANRNPKITPYGQIQPDGSNPGRTIYIGSLQSSKFVRFYEKGYEYYKKELAMEEPDTPRILGIQKLFETGEPAIVSSFNNEEPFDIRDWIRAEVELKDGNCELPLEILILHDDFFAGAYPYLGEILNMADGKKPPRLMTETEMDFDIRIGNMKAIAGSLIDDLIYLGYTDKQIVNMLKGGKGPSQKLIRSGILAPQDELVTQ